MQILSAAADKSKIEITAKHVDATKNIVTATDNVVVYYEDSVIKASSAHFNKLVLRYLWENDTQQSLNLNILSSIFFKVSKTKFTTKNSAGYLYIVVINCQTLFSSKRNASTSR